MVVQIIIIMQRHVRVVSVDLIVGSQSRCSDQVVPEEQVDTTVPLLKEDVYSYGVLLLRLFCPRQMPEDDTQLVEWVRTCSDFP